MTRIPQHTYRVTFAGVEYTRTTWTVYTHAAKSGDRFRGTVTFHKSEAAARRRAGQSGQVKPLTQPAGVTQTEHAPNRSIICGCGKTVIVDGFGQATGNTCPQCDPDRYAAVSRVGTSPVRPVK